LLQIAKLAMQQASRTVPIKTVIISITGELLKEDFS
jgi:hypothetical protein